MEIIKPGRKIDIWPKIFVCIHCDAELSVSESDIKDLKESFYNIYGFRCPCCNKINEVFNKDFDLCVKGNIGRITSQLIVNGEKFKI